MWFPGLGFIAPLLILFAGMALGGVGQRNQVFGDGERTAYRAMSGPLTTS